MTEVGAPQLRLATNPFHVLGLRPNCTRADVEREGQKLLGMLELGLIAAQTYGSPLGTHERSPTAVREAMAELRDPQRRLVHELWATLEPVPPIDSAQPSTPSYPGFEMLGFRSRGRR